VNNIDSAALGLHITIVGAPELPVSVRISIRHDPKAGVYVAYGEDLEGLVVEADSLDELIQEACAAAEGLLEVARISPN
jgi:predicted RNase H-like HicB family nuclease